MDELVIKQPEFKKKEKKKKELLHGPDPLLKMKDKFTIEHHNKFDHHP